MIVCPAVSPQFMQTLKPSTALSAARTFFPHLIKKHVGRSPLWVVQVEIRGRMAARYYECVQWCDRMVVVERQRQLVLRDDLPITWVHKMHPADLCAMLARTARRSLSSRAPLLVLHL
jgi:hypothetical protein